MLVAGSCALSANAERGGAGDLGASCPGVAAIMGHGIKDWIVDGNAALAIIEDGPGDDGVAVAPGGEIILIVEDAGAGEGACAVSHPYGSRPGLAPIGGVRYQDVRGVAAADPLRKDEAQRRKIGGGMRIETHRRIACSDVAVEGHGVCRPGLAAVEGDMGARVDGLIHPSASGEEQL